jgi:hypothetical protein
LIQILYLISFSFFFTLNAFASENNLELLETEINNLRLYEENDWLLLNHYQKNEFGFYKSRIDDPDFFLSKSKNDPEEELISFVKELVNEKSDGDLSLQCKFPARFDWIESKLNLVKRNYIIRKNCPEFLNWEKSLDVSRVVLVFPSAYLNNPASMFGHTLLRLDSRAGIDNPLLSYAASFGASTGEDGGIAFAVKGLFGGYRASYSVEPYYETVKRYGDIEHRDIWEYQLKLTEEEVSKLVKSLWELGHTYFDYYFFDENCSYYLLTLLETIRPEFKFIDNFGYWVIPSDTLKVVLAKKEVVGDVAFRPSLTKKLEISSEEIDSNKLDHAIAIAKGEEAIDSISSFGESDRAKILEFSFDYLEFENSKKKGDQVLERKTAQNILFERSKLSSDKKIVKKSIIEDARPDQSHDSGRFFSRVGRRGGAAFYDLEIKPAYHDLLDSTEGFKSGAAIDFFALRFRQYESDNFQLQSFTPVSIESLSPWNKLFQPFSWTVKAALDREIVPRVNFSDLQGSLGMNLSVNSGITLEPAENFIISILPGIKNGYNPSYLDSKYAFGPSGIIKLSYELTEDLRMISNFEIVRFVLGEEHTSKNGSFEVNLDITKDVILRTGISRQASFNQYFNEFYIGAGFYF